MHPNIQHFTANQRKYKAQVKSGKSYYCQNKIPQKQNTSPGKQLGMEEVSHFSEAITASGNVWLMLRQIICKVINSNSTLKVLNKIID